MEENPSLKEETAWAICQSMRKNNQLNRDFCQCDDNSMVFLSGEWDISKSFPVISLVANKVLLYRTLDNGIKHFIYIPSEVLEKAANTMNGKPINWNHDHKKEGIGTYEDAKYEDNKLSGTLKINSKEYQDWIDSLRKDNIIPNVSVEMRVTGDKIEIEKGFIEVLYDAEFQGIALTPKGVCSPEDGCGIPLREAKIGGLTKTMTQTPEFSFLDFLDAFCEKNDLEFAEWTTAYVNDLPDSAFAVVIKGKKDDEGKTIPRANRKLPYKDANGKVDLPHLRNALARAPQMTGVSAEQRTAAIAELQRAAKEYLPSYKEKGEEMSKEEEKEEETTEKAMSLSDEQIGAIEKKLSAQMEEQLKPFLETQKELTAFLKKFSPEPEKEDCECDEKKLSVEEQVEKEVTKFLAEKERQELIKELSEKYKDAPLDSMTTDALKYLRTIPMKKESDGEAKDPGELTRKTLTAEEFEKMEFSEAGKDVMFMNMMRNKTGRSPVDKNLALAHLNKKDSIPTGWFPTEGE